MKRSLKSNHGLGLALCLAGLAGTAQAQESIPGRMVSLDVGRFVYSLVQPSTAVLIPLEFEGAVSSTVSIFAAPRLAIRSGSIGLGLGVGARFYFFQGPALSGLWAGPELGILYGAATPSTLSATWALSLGGAAGYNFIFGRSLILSLGINIGVVGVGSSSLLFDLSPRLVVGYAF
ncbi:MAG: hypothetical protein M3Y59_11200 [Myxococcota bacterium]|nr:hypothetical protein [Myxococcota bacterium]